MIRPLLIVLACAGLLAVAGCSRPPPPHSISHQTTKRASDPARVAVLPFWSGDKVGRSANVVGETFAASLRELAHHEVILVSNERRKSILPGGDDVLAVGSIKADDLIQLREALHVDAVVLGRIEQFESFDPVSIGLSVHLVSCLDGEVLWSATAHLDSSRDEVQQDLKYWYKDLNGTGNTSIGGWKMALSSPALFSRYACDRLVETLVWKE